MLERLKQSLVESYIGAIALGYLLAVDILRFVSIFTAPVAAWAARSEVRSIIPRQVVPEDSYLQAALPQLMEFLLLGLLWYVLFRWLYLKLPQHHSPEAD